MPRIIIPPPAYTIAEAARLTGIAWQTIGDRCAKHGLGTTTDGKLRLTAAEVRRLPKLAGKRGRPKKPGK
jgi:hypothetical protein